MKKSILFLRPDYHCSFLYRNEFRRLGWKADIYVPPDYPEKMLYSNEGILRAFRVAGDSCFSKVLNFIFNIGWYLSHFWRYKYHFVHGRLPVFTFHEEKIRLDAVFGQGFLVSLWLAKIFGCKIIYLPTGCRDEETMANFSKLDAGNVCNNCGSICDDRQNNLNFLRIRQYADMAVGVGNLDSSQYAATHFKYKSIDLNLWKPGLNIPVEHLLPFTQNLRILHSFISTGRDFKGRNIKGSPHILAAIEKLKQEGYAVEYIYIKDKPSNQMRFYQAQADIVVEQLIYGWWGSTGVETLALGKPVICYINSQWKSSFLRTFPEYSELPIVEANTETIYEVLKKLVVDQEYRQKKGRESREFAESFFNPSKNAKALADLLLEL